MSWVDLDKPVNTEQAEKYKAESQQKQSDMAKAYHRLFNTDDGKRVLADLTAKMLYNNDTDFTSVNVNYEAAYHNGEAGAVKHIINQIRKAEVL